MDDYNMARALASHDAVLFAGPPDEPEEDEDLARCVQCGKVLPEDSTAEYCDNDCAYQDGYDAAIGRMKKDFARPLIAVSRLARAFDAREALTLERVTASANLRSATTAGDEMGVHAASCELSRVWQRIRENEGTILGEATVLMRDIESAARLAKLI